MSVCPSCEKKNPDEAKHCMHCGKPIYYQDSPSKKSTPGFMPDERLKAWFKYLYRWSGYSRLMNDKFDSTKAAISKMPSVLTSDEKNYGVFIPIINKEWAIGNANGITNGALTTLNTRFVIYDFTQQKSYSVYYNTLKGVERKKDLITISCSNTPEIKLQFKTGFGRQAAWMWVNVLAGVAGSFSSNSGDKVVSHLSSRDAIDDSSNEIEVISAYLDTIYNFFVEAMNGIDE